MMKTQLLLLGITLTALAGCDALFGPDDRHATRLLVVGGDAQVDTVDAPLSEPLAVEVHDQNGEPLPGVEILWRLIAGSASVDSSASVTGEDGRTGTSLTLGREPGEVTVAAEADSVVVRFTATVLPGRAVVLTLDPDSVHFTAVGDSIRLAGLGADRYDNPIDAPEIDWSTADPDVIHVDATGYARATGEGATVVVGESGDASDTVRITVRQELASFAVTAARDTLDALADTTRVSARLLDANGNDISGRDVEWESLDASVAEIDAAGLATARGNGSARIVGRVADAADTTRITVRQLPVSLDLEAPADTLFALDDTLRITPDARDANGYRVEAPPVAWSSLDTTIASITADGLVRSRENGEADIEATLDSLADTMRIIVAQRPAIVAIDAPVDTLRALGDTIRLAAAVRDANGHPVEGATVDWRSSSPDVATVDADGRVIALANGSSEILATSGNRADTLRMVVRQQAVRVSVSPREPAPLTAIDATVRIGVTAEDANGHAIADPAPDWSSTRPNVATVDATGRVRAVGNGTARISARLDGVADTASIVVDQEVVALRLDTPSDTLRHAGDRLHLRARALDANGYEAPDAEIRWRSLAPSIASVDEAGVVTAVAEPRETARIRAAAGGFADTVTVTLIPYGVLTVTFDDVYANQYSNAFPILKSYGIEANLAVPTGWVGESGHLSLAQIREMHDEGWSIVPHTVTHAELRQISVDSMHWEMDESRRWVEDHGFRGSNVFVVPFHRWAARERSAIESRFDAARGWGVDHSSNGGMVQWPVSDPYALTSIPADIPEFDFTTRAGREEIERWWAQAVSSGRFVGIYFHRIPDDAADAFERTIRRLSKYAEHVRTYSELFP